MMGKLESYLQIEICIVFLFGGACLGPVSLLLQDSEWLHRPLGPALCLSPSRLHLPRGADPHHPAPNNLLLIPALAPIPNLAAPHRPGNSCTPEGGWARLVLQPEPRARPASSGSSLAVAASSASQVLSWVLCPRSGWACFSLLGRISTMDTDHRHAEGDT